MATPEKLTFLATWDLRARMIPGLRPYQRPGMGSSYPLPVLTDDGVSLAQFYHFANLLDPDTMIIQAPGHLVRLSYPDWQLIEAIQTDFGLPPFPDTPYTLTPPERDARRPLLEQLEALYEEVMANYPQPPSRATADNLIAALQQVVPSVLWPYYQALAESFYAWVDRSG